MISIREANDLTASILSTHVGFVGPYAKSVTKFYIDIFKVLPELQKPTATEKTIKAKVLAIKRKDNLTQYKSLLYPILKGKIGIKNEDELKKLKYNKNISPSAKSYSEIVNSLESLEKNIDAILALDFNIDQAAKIVLYDSWKNEYKPIVFLLKQIFDYEGWFSDLSPKEQYGPYQLAIALNVKTCAYCNRHYTFSIVDGKGKKMGRPDFDHFLPKSSNPLLAMSFYNLVPSCKGCNGPSIKSSKPVSYNTHLNPYEDNLSNGLMRFTYYPNSYEASVGNSEDLQVRLAYSGDSSNANLKAKIEGNIKLFCLSEIYKYHADVVQDIIQKRHISNDKHIEIVQLTFKNFGLTKEDAYRIAYGNYYLEKDFHKRPLSKLTKDIAIEMKKLVVLPKPKP